MSRGGGALSARLAMLVESLAPPRAVARAHHMRETTAQAIDLRPTEQGVELEGDVEADGGRWPVRVSWDLSPAALRLRAALAASSGPGGGPAGGSTALPALLPDPRRLRTKCGCGQPEPCGHALALLLALGHCLDRRPETLWRGGQEVVQPLPPGDAVAPSSPHPEAAAAAEPRPSTPARSFWTFAPPAAADLSDVDPAEGLSLETLPGLPTSDGWPPEELRSGLVALWRATREAMRTTRPQDPPDDPRDHGVKR